jgi:hypothetical protein
MDDLYLAVLVAQAWYWMPRAAHRINGRPWFYKTYEEWNEETGLLRHVDTVRIKLGQLVARGILLKRNYRPPRDDRRRPSRETTRWWSLNVDRLDELYEASPHFARAADRGEITQGGRAHSGGDGGEITQGLPYTEIQHRSSERESCMHAAAEVSAAACMPGEGGPKNACMPEAAAGDPTSRSEPSEDQLLSIEMLVEFGCNRKTARERVLSTGVTPDAIAAYIDDATNRGKGVGIVLIKMRDRDPVMPNLFSTFVDEAVAEDRAVALLVNAYDAPRTAAAAFVRRMGSNIKNVGPVVAASQTRSDPLAFLVNALGGGPADLDAMRGKK